ncbi:alpha/beta hydrolase [Mycolicibacterium fluoranthenivorans]|uniref:Pimeloyl-ACP methyl ester carboxylesterase n=1 Tax=Mycolicibacterium fluoranthenivorans TaxID=258505 RepID=A0A7X5TZP8_9MYCO|nr:alpha/beta hydrolase [Mycolicibacterium fluoranthenivorans]MCV7358203.1 alpha/beta hydrolase [Mycolicibacterium fluoranthenivorans]NIH95672.1 pimeloyl-ACP methyl ester carboxylesterase [Mycolicibacterium fluoranthenivorans]
MAVNLRGVTTVLLAGTGSDDDYVYRAFSGALHEVGAVLVTPPPQPEQLIAGYLAALDEAARGDERNIIAVGGVSIGAAVATSWALAHPAHTVAVLVALPAWTGPPDGAPAALSARHTAQLLRTDGLAATVATMRASSPSWLGEELTRSWLAQWPALPDAMDAAAGHVSPTSAELATLPVPMGVAAATDDPIHPVDVALEWVAAAPHAALRTVTLHEMGTDPGALGAACVGALLDL